MRCFSARGLKASRARQGSWRKLSQLGEEGFFPPSVEELVGDSGLGVGVEDGFGGFIFGLCAGDSGCLEGRRKGRELGSKAEAWGIND